ncbi:hypothetical protein [Streptomyces prunicolor]|uniref:hypothetical protein n=1 Tax=Streptomyces prunicolor TaxID=67348 RepID=UPI00341A63D8
MVGFRVRYVLATELVDELAELSAAAGEVTGEARQGRAVSVRPGLAEPTSARCVGQGDE